MIRSAWLFAVPVAVCPVVLGCQCDRKDNAVEGAPVAAPHPSASAKKVLKPEDLPPELLVPTAWPIPQGPMLLVVPGQGFGAIRFGASVETVERLMEAPCEIRSETACRYIVRGAEFFLKNGAVVEMRAHRPNRPTEPPPRQFGIFNGRTPEGVAPLMLPTGVRELIGAPLRVEKVADGGPAQTVEIYHYNGMRLEFDRLPNGKEVVGGIVITKD